MPEVIAELIALWDIVATVGAFSIGYVTYVSIFVGLPLLALVTSIYCLFRKKEQNKLELE